MKRKKSSEAPAVPQGAATLLPQTEFSSSLFSRVCGSGAGFLPLGPAALIHYTSYLARFVRTLAQLFQRFLLTPEPQLRTSAAQGIAVDSAPRE